MDQDLDGKIHLLAQKALQRVPDVRAVVVGDAADAHKGSTLPWGRLLLGGRLLLRGHLSLQIRLLLCQAHRLPPGAGRRAHLPIRLIADFLHCTLLPFRYSSNLSPRS